MKNGWNALRYLMIFKYHLNKILYLNILDIKIYYLDFKKTLPKFL